MFKKCVSLFATGLICLGIPIATVAADANFPSKTMTWVIPFPAGSGSDLTARAVAQEISQLTGKPVVVENKPGANGTIATRHVANAAPDGHTLLVTSNTHYANQFLLKSLPYDPVKDFETVAMVREPSPLILVVGAESPYNTLAELTQAVKSGKTELSYGSGNSSSRVAAELYKQLTGGDILYVPYKGNNDALQDVMAGRVDMIFSDIGAMKSLYEGKRVKALAVAGEKPLPFLKDVPSAPQADMPELQLSSWGIFLAPAGTSSDVLEKLNELFAQAVEAESIKQLFTSMNGVATKKTRPELNEFVEKQIESWGAIIKEAGIPPV